MEPDYIEYTVDELLDAKANIDAVAYPENYERLITELNKRNIDTEKLNILAGVVSSFERVGKVLIVIGVIDIVAMTLVIFSDSSYSYSSQFNIFAIIIGYFLYIGSVKIAYITRWLSLFIFVSYILTVLFYPIILPLDLLLLYLQLMPGQILDSVLFLCLSLAIYLWVYETLSNKESLEAFANHNYKCSFPKTAPITSVILFIVVGIIIFLVLKGESASKAIDLAKQRYGKQYNYHLNSINYSGDSGSAIITVYSKNQLKYIEVKW